MQKDPDEYALSISSVMMKLIYKIKKAYSWAKRRIKHKVGHLKPSYILDILGKHGLALVVIIVGWEIAEDLLFPIMFVWLGNNVHPAFYAGAPASIILCFHWLAIPVLWGFWMKITGQKKSIDHSEHEDCC